MALTGVYKRLSQHFPIFRSLGIDHVVASGVSGQGVQHKLIAQAGNSPFAVTFAGMGLADMADGSYDVVVQNLSQSPSVGYADNTTRTTAGFSVAAAANGDQLVLIILGRIKGQLA